MVTVYRVGKLPERKDLENKNALWFDNLSTIPEECSPRSNSVFACFSQEEAKEWVNWRLDRSLDSDLWSITTSYPLIYAHPVDLYHYARNTEWFQETGIIAEMTAVEASQKYWLSKTNVTAYQPNGTPWEVLIPYKVAQEADWELIERIIPSFSVPETYFTS